MRATNLAKHQIVKLNTALNLNNLNDFNILGYLRIVSVLLCVCMIFL